MLASCLRRSRTGPRINCVASSPTLGEKYFLGMVVYPSVGAPIPATTFNREKSENRRMKRIKGTSRPFVVAGLAPRFLSCPHPVLGNELLMSAVALSAIGFGRSSE